MNFIKKGIFILIVLEISFSFAKAHLQQQSGNVHFDTNDSASDAINLIGKNFVNLSGHHGLSIGFVKNGKKYSYLFGTTEIRKQNRPTDSTIYEIASITKSFTGILLAQAIIEKRISLNDYVQKYLPKPFPNLSFKGIPLKIKDLATHTSGLPKFIPGLVKGLTPDQLVKHFNNFSKQQFLDSLSEVKIDTIPGSKFIYSNSDAQLIGIILENVYHTTYARLLTRYITGPMQMGDTKLEIPTQDLIRFAKGYNDKGEIMPRLDWWRMTPAAGYIKSTISDMMKYVLLNINEDIPAVKLAHQPLLKVSEEGADGIGLYWFLKKSEGSERIIYHAGGGFGTTSYCEIHLHQRNGIVLLANDASAGTENELKTIASLIFKLENN